MQTSAQHTHPQPPAAEADLFGAATTPPTAHPPAVDCTLHITGVLAQRAELRTRVCDAMGHTVPVLCFDLIHVGAGQQRVHVEIPFTDRALAMARMNALQRGHTYTVSTQLRDMRLLLPNAALVTD